MRPQLIVHRVNTIKELKQTPAYLGVEIDLRSRGSKIILHHEPFCDGEEFGAWLDCYQHKTLILNVKEEGLEKVIISMLSKRNINDYFFLDVSFPFLVWLSTEGINKFAVRFSEFESLETVLNMQGRANYVWVDCFTTQPLNREVYDKLKKAGFQICLASPELQKRDVSEIEVYANALRSQAIDIDAICTKRPELWEEVILRK